MMGLFDFLFGGSESSFDTEDFRRVKTAVIAQAVLAIGPHARTGIVATMTTTACLVGIRMMIMIFDNDKL